jgi:predicted lipoprotein with Yx(FWY)xxD motif
VGFSNTGIGKILVDSRGRTLYLFKADQGTKSACTGACASAWPPLLVKGKPTLGNGVNASLVGTAARPEGTTQLTYNGHPVYLFAQDQQAGETNGQGVSAFGAAWFALNSAGNQVSAQPSSSSTGGGGGLGY